MAWNKDKEITMEIEPDFDFIIEEVLILLLM